MIHSPFRFLDSLAALALLGQALERIGLSELGITEGPPDAANPYHPACLRYGCAWLSDPVELQWHFRWWPDGIESELSHVLVTFQGAVIGAVNVEALVARRLARPLAEHVVEEIAARCSEVTGKRPRYMC